MVRRYLPHQKAGAALAVHFIFDGIGNSNILSG